MGFKRVHRNSRRLKKKHVSRKKLIGTSDRPRVVVFRSLKNIYAQLVDDSEKKTIVTVSTVSRDLKEEINNAESKTEAAMIVGKALAEKAKSLNIKRVVFDRSGYIYHGRVRALAEGARKGGLEF